MSEEEQQAETKKRGRSVRVRPTRVPVSTDVLFEIVAISNETGRSPSEIIEDAIRYASAIHRADIFSNVTVRDIIMADIAKEELLKRSLSTNSLVEDYLSRRSQEIKDTVSFVERIYGNAYKTATEDVAKQLLEVLQPTIRDAVAEELAKVFTSAFTAKDYEALRESLSPQARAEAARRAAEAEYSDLVAKINEAKANAFNKVKARLEPLLQYLIDKLVDSLITPLDRMPVMAQAVTTKSIPKIKTKTAILPHEQTQQEQQPQQPTTNEEQPKQ